MLVQIEIIVTGNVSDSAILSIADVRDIVLFKEVNETHHTEYYENRIIINYHPNNTSTRINKPINVIGSRAAGTAKAGSDWDYIIDNINSKEWGKIKNSLPGSKSVMDNTPKNIDIIKTPLDKSRPYITIYPRNKK